MWLLFHVICLFIFVSGVHVEDMVLLLFVVGKHIYTACFTSKVGKTYVHNICIHVGKTIVHVFYLHACGHNACTQRVLIAYMWAQHMHICFTCIHVGKTIVHMSYLHICGQNNYTTCISCTHGGQKRWTQHVLLTYIEGKTVEH